MAHWKTLQHISRPSKSAEIVEYRCKTCNDGFYWFDGSLKRIEKNNQLPHKCNKCGAVAYFPYPYPIVSVNGQRFVHWDIIKGENIDISSHDK